MSSANFPPMIDHLMRCAAAWCAAHDAVPLGRLGRLAINDAGVFSRLEAPDANLTLATLQRLARFLSDPANWPEGAAVPEEVTAFAQRVCGQKVAA